MKKCYLKTIRLYPTDFCVDVWICKDLNLLANEFNKRYGASVEYYKDNLCEDAVQVIRATNDSELKGDKTIVMNVQSLDIAVLFHEFNHVYYHLCDIIHVELTQSNQEWHSYMIEYLYNECKYFNKFELRK